MQPRRPFGGQTTYLDQGWDTEQREEFYFTAQGSQLIPYKWFLELEQARAPKPFRDAKNMRRYGILTAKPTERNPDGLPVGFVRDGVDPVASRLAKHKPMTKRLIAATTRMGLKKQYLGAEYDEKVLPEGAGIGILVRSHLRGVPHA